MKIKYDISKYTQKQAYEKVDNFLDSLVIQYSNMVSDSVKNWNDKKDQMIFTFKAKSFEISGDIKIKENELILNGKLPWAAKLFSGTIENIIKKNLNELFP